MTQERMVLLFNEWLKRYQADPAEFGKLTTSPDYGTSCAAYMATLDSELPQ